MLKAKTQQSDCITECQWLYVLLVGLPCVKWNLITTQASEELLCHKPCFLLVYRTPHTCRHINSSSFLEGVLSTVHTTHWQGKRVELLELLYIDGPWEGDKSLAHVACGCVSLQRKLDWCPSAITEVGQQVKHLAFIGCKTNPAAIALELAMEHKAVPHVKFTVPGSCKDSTLLCQFDESSRGMKTGLEHLGMIGLCLERDGKEAREKGREGQQH